ncbi:MAG: phenylalanine--tRNA ligase subunit beta [Oscillospiraceae bacterium]
MILPLKWAQQYADFSCTAQEFADKMTMTGSKVEKYECEADKIKNVVIGRVVKLERHQNSDHLWVCQIDVGSETVQIVTGAQNLKEGDLCPVALHGAKLPGGVEIKRGKLRGEPSNGMMCGLLELGLTTHDFPNAIEDGIMVLDEEAPLGADAIKVLGLDDIAFEFEITPNRPDCLSVLGLAREAAATFGVPFTVPSPKLPAGTGDVTPLLKAKINSADSCLRYSAAMVENVRIKPSPRWLRKRLRLSGVRPINNIVDITNYVMLEYGQPMHAFDYAYVNGAAITVRKALPQEKIMTLDGVERNLDESITVIADEKGPIAIAGIMGGEFSGVYETTQRVVFESACFDGPAVRAASRKLGLRTESSGRFEKGLDPNNAGPALRRALELVVELDAGDVIGGILDDYPAPRQPRTIPLRPQEIATLLGIEVSKEKIISILEPLGFVIEGENIVIPTTRYDVARDCDLAEEVARFVGYNQIPSTNLSGAVSARLSERQIFNEKINNAMVGYGFWECETFSFYSPRSFDMINLPAGDPLRNTVTISNPLGEETSLMRTTALPSILDVAARNWAARAEEAALYETATEYRPNSDAELLPYENKKIVLAAYGAHWDYTAVKGVVEGLLETVGVCHYTVRRAQQDSTYHPGRSADFYLKVNGEEVLLGRAGEIHPAVADNYGMRAKIVAADISLDVLFAARGGVAQYKPLPKFPAITRDLALVANMDVPAAEIAACIESAGGNLLESYKLFDIYTGNQLGEGKKSLAYSLVYRSSTSTLTDADAETSVQNILQKLSKLNVTLRG